MEKGNFDGKLFTLLLLKSRNIVLCGIIAGALIIGVPYFLSKTVIGTFNYRSEITVHVEYGEDSAGNRYDYINYYTWGQWIRSDRYIELLFENYGYALADSFEELKEALDAEVPADQRVVVFTVVTTNQGRSDMIAAAVADSIVDFVNTIPEVKSAELISADPSVKYFVYKNIPQAFVFGALLGLFVSVFGLWIGFLLDDSVYIPEIFERETGINVTEEKSECEITIEGDRPDLSNLSGPVTLVIKCGAHNGKAVGYVLHECKKKGIEIKNARLSDVDDKLVSAYYKGSKFPGLFPGEKEE